jgi:hypothetical protein
LIKENNPAIIGTHCVIRKQDLATKGPFHMTCVMRWIWQ